MAVDFTDDAGFAETARSAPVTVHPSALPAESCPAYAVPEDRDELFGAFVTAIAVDSGVGFVAGSGGDLVNELGSLSVGRDFTFASGTGYTIDDALVRLSGSGAGRLIFSLDRALAPYNGGSAITGYRIEWSGGRRDDPGRDCAVRRSRARSHLAGGTGSASVCRLYPRSPDTPTQLSFASNEARVTPNAVVV